MPIYNSNIFNNVFTLEYYLIKSSFSTTVYLMLCLPYIKIKLKY